jgi:hypothetical protein
MSNHKFDLQLEVSTGLWKCSITEQDKGIFYLVELTTPEYFSDEKIEGNKISFSGKSIILTLPFKYDKAKDNYYFEVSAKKPADLLELEIELSNYLKVHNLN